MHSYCYLTSPGNNSIVSFYENDQMPVIIYKNYKHLVTLYNVIFSNMTDILSHFSYIFYQHKRAAMCHCNEMHWETYLTKLIHKLLFL